MARLSHDMPPPELVLNVSGLNVSGAGGAYGSISSAARAASPASWIGGRPPGAGACSAGASCSHSGTSKDVATTVTEISSA